MSKSFAMAGLRIGWLATRDRDLLERCARMKDYTTICSSAPSEVLALIGLRARDRVLARSRRIVADNLAVLDDFFARRADRLTWVRPRGGSIGLPAARSTTSRSTTFAARLVEAEGVLLLPGSQFGHPGNHFRIGFGRENLPAARRAARGVPRPRLNLAAAIRLSSADGRVDLLHPSPARDFAATMTDEEKAVWSVHFERFERLLVEGTIILVGPTLGSQHRASAIFEAPDEEAARRFMDEDPVIAGGFARASCGRSGSRCCAAATRSGPPRDLAGDLAANG